LNVYVVDASVASRFLFVEDLSDKVESDGYAQNY